MTETAQTIMMGALHTSCSRQDIFGYLDAKLDCDLMAQAAITALKAAGYAIVPVEPTKEQTSKLREEVKTQQGITLVYPSLEQCKEGYRAAIKAGANHEAG